LPLPVFSPAMSIWPAAVLFDFDGVIVNSEPVHFAAFQQLFAALGIIISKDEYYRELIGFDDRGVINHVMKMRNRAIGDIELHQLAARKLELMRELLARGDVPALPGVHDFVRALAKNYPLAICSGAVREEISLMLEGVGLAPFFKVIVAAEDVAVGKPDPMGYLLTTRLVGQQLGRALSPADMLIIEDAPTVTASVRSVGFPVLAVATSYPIEALSHANWAVNSLEIDEVRKKIPELKL
jgi:beta-phosphoglucomutase